MLKYAQIKLIFFFWCTTVTKLIWKILKVNIRLSLQMFALFMLVSSQPVWTLLSWIWCWHIFLLHRVMVLDAGQIVEFDTPSNLLEKRGHFYSMAKDAGITQQTTSAFFWKVLLIFLLVFFFFFNNTHCKMCCIYRKQYEGNMLCMYIIFVKIQ